MTTLRIVQLYPDLLGITGDRGNVEVLASRARMAGFEADVSAVGIGDAAAADADVIVIGNGPLSAMRVVQSDLATRATWLRERLEDGAVVLAVGGGAELLSAGVELLDGTGFEGLGMLPVTVTRTRRRRVGYVVADAADGQLVGFEDHASEWTLTPGADVASWYGSLVAGSGSATGYESVLVGTLFASNVQGPLLPLNPRLADRLLSDAFARTGAAYAPGAAHAVVDAHADAARAEIIRLAVNKRFNAIAL